MYQNHQYSLFLSAAQLFLDYNKSWAKNPSLVSFPHTQKSVRCHCTPQSLDMMKMHTYFNHAHISSCKIVSWTSFSSFRSICLSIHHFPGWLSGSKMTHQQLQFVIHGTGTVIRSWSANCRSVHFPSLTQ